MCPIIPRQANHYLHFRIGSSSLGPWYETNPLPRIEDTPNTSRKVKISLLKGSTLDPIQESRSMTLSKRERTVKKKKTHLLKFMAEHRKTERPCAVENNSTSDYLPIRYGLFSGLKDTRRAHCRFKRLPAANLHVACLCRQVPVISSPLHQSYTPPQPARRSKRENKGPDMKLYKYV